MLKEKRYQIAVDDSRMNCGKIENNKYKTCSLTSEYVRSIPDVFNIEKSGDEIKKKEKKSYRKKANQDTPELSLISIYQENIRMTWYLPLMAFGFCFQIAMRA